MNQILSEKEYQTYFLNKLKNENGYIIRDASNYDPCYAMDKVLLIQFLDETQPDKMAKLRKIYKEKTEDTIVACVNTAITQRNSSLLSVLKNGVEISNTCLDLMYTKPATDFNKELSQKYEQNIFSVMEEVWASNKERIDVVVFLNGLAIMTFELKCEMAGQTYENAIIQYRKDRKPKNRLFLFKAGAFVNFAMDLNEVYMTTELKGLSTTFLPFNKGNGVGINAGKGNPVYDDRFPVYYMWDEILKKDMVIELISKFIFVEIKEKENLKTGKIVKKETLIFPRYHQLDCVRKILEDVKINETSQNYLIQHSAGSGKTNEIAWLAHRLASLHTDDNRNIFDNIIIVTDRIVVDRQLQDAVRRLDHKNGMIKVMDEKCTSQDLKKALEGNTKIIATTITKFLYIVDTVKKLSDKKFAVIIDEAHSSTAGKDMAAVNKALGQNIDYEDDSFLMDTEEIIVDEISKSGKQPNVSMFAFTATPKPTTLQIFGRANINGQREAFHVYSMKQAIEEGFILDVLQSYTTYKTFYTINKSIENDPVYKSKAAKQKIVKFAMLHETNISQRVEIIIEHFRNNVMQELGGQAKAMVVTSSRAEAVKYRQAFQDYVDRHGYAGIHALVAFSGKVAGKDVDKKYDGSEFSESSMNGFPEDRTPKEFDTDEYQVLIVANKYQTGFDQPKLCAMYILKKLKGVNAVQTLSRLNRTCYPYDKKVFVLDFVNTVEDIEKAFKPYYTTTLLTNTVNRESVYELESKVNEFDILDVDDINTFTDILYSDDKSNATKKATVNACLQRAKKKFDLFDEKKQRECYLTLRKFVRFYEFLLLISSFKDTNVDLYKKYKFITYLISYLKVNSAGNGFDLDDKIRADVFYQKYTGTTKKVIEAKPEVKLPMTDIILTDDEKKELSVIVEEINLKTSLKLDEDQTVKALMQIQGIMDQDQALKGSMDANTESDFHFAYLDKADNALVAGLDTNKKLFTLLLNDDELKKRTFGLLASDMYRKHMKEKEDAKKEDQ